MFIRYNQPAKYWEYDTSVAQDGTGPWLILPIDASQIYNPIPVPPNIAFTNAKNIFTKSQEIQDESGVPWANLWLRDKTQPLNKKLWRITNAAQELYFQSLPDNAVDSTPGAEEGHVVISRNGLITSTNAVIANRLESVGQGGAVRMNNSLIPGQQGQLYRFINSGGHLYLELWNAGSTAVVSNPIAVNYSTGGIYTSFVYGNGFQFPNAQVASSDGNTLDDYEEGNWTPSWTSDAGGAGTAYTAQLGVYVKVGRLVHLSAEISITAANWTGGNALLSGLPFVTDSGAYWGGVTIGYWYNTGIGSVGYNFTLIPGDTRAYCYLKNNITSGGSDALLLATQIAPNTHFRLGITYRTAP